MATNQEIKKTFQLVVDEPNIIQLTMNGPVNTVADNVRQATFITEQFQNIFGSFQDKQFDCIVDLSSLTGMAHYPSPEARRLYAEMMNHERLARIAVVAPSTISRSIMRFITYASSKKRGTIKFFKTIDEARAWLGGKTEIYIP